jgi:hypothetical protein
MQPESHAERLSLTSFLATLLATNVWFLMQMATYL